MPPRECASENEAHSRGGNRLLAEARRRHGLLARPLAALAFPMRGRGQRVAQNRMHNPMHAPSGLARVGGCQHRVRTRACKGEMHHGTSRQAAVHAALRAFGRRGGRHRDFEGHHPRRSGRKERAANRGELHRAGLQGVLRRPELLQSSRRRRGGRRLPHHAPVASAGGAHGRARAVARRASGHRRRRLLHS